jgi:hypothetical protein
MVSCGGCCDQVQEQVPKATPAGSQWVYKETLELGKTDLTDVEVRSVLSAIRNDFPAKKYDLTSRNCNHFTEVKMQTKATCAYACQRASIAYCVEENRETETCVVIL